MDESPNEFKELQALLRLKKYELPPQGYEERFLKEFHRRQRWDESRPRGWAALLEKWNDWTGSLTVPRYAYASTFGLFLVAALAINNFTGKPVSGDTAVAVSTRNVAPSALALNRPLDLSELDAPVQDASLQGSSSVGTRPRYVLDARPASYEAPFSF